MNNTYTCNLNDSCLQTRKINDIATKPTVFEQTPGEVKKVILREKKIFQFLILERTPDTRMNNTCTCNENSFTALAKSVKKKLEQTNESPTIQFLPNIFFNCMQTEKTQGPAETPTPNLIVQRRLHYS